MYIVYYVICTTSIVVQIILNLLIVVRCSNSKETEKRYHGDNNYKTSRAAVHAGCFPSRFIWSLMNCMSPSMPRRYVCRVSIYELCTPSKSSCSLHTAIGSCIGPLWWVEAYGCLSTGAYRFIVAAGALGFPAVVSRELLA